MISSAIPLTTTSGTEAENVMDNDNSLHKWCFFRSGGFDPVALDPEEDLKHLAELDPKLWTVLMLAIAIVVIWYQDMFARLLV